MRDSVRDETVVGLGAVNGKEYVRTLRRAMDLRGFHQVTFICHMLLLLRLADRIPSRGEGEFVVGNSGEAVTDLRISGPLQNQHKC